MLQRYCTKRTIESGAGSYSVKRAGGQTHPSRYLTGGATGRLVLVGITGSCQGSSCLMSCTEYYRCVIYFRLVTVVQRWPR